MLLWEPKGYKTNWTSSKSKTILPHPIETALCSEVRIPPVIQGVWVKMSKTEAYQYSRITFKFANTSFKIAAASYFSYQKEAEVFQMAQLQNVQLDVVQSRPFGGLDCKTKAVVSQYF
ncbi:unnamed protein product [Coccothraustes coccothraustes]